MTAAIKSYGSYFPKKKKGKGKVNTEQKNQGAGATRKIRDSSFEHSIRVCSKVDSEVVHL